MTSFEYEFNQQDKELVISQDSGTFSGADYIRLTIYPQESINNIVTLPNTNTQAIFYSSLADNVLIDVSPFGVGVTTQTFRDVGVKLNPDTNQPYNDFQIYQNGDDIYIKPNEIFNTFELPEGDYRIQIDFLNQFNFADSFVIKQISTSRKEVRLKPLNVKIVDGDDIIQTLSDTLNEGTDKYQFRHILNIGDGNHNRIMNYAVDSVTDGLNNQSLILKLYEPLPSNITNLSFVTLEKEVLTTQTQDIFYFSDVPDIFFGDGLLPDQQENWINSVNQDIIFENLNELALSASINDIEINAIISQSQYGYPNLNTDFNEFSNHTNFGSAKKKLENFRTKVETIQGHYSDISESLYSLGVAIGGDSNFVTQKRINLFKKINAEISNFTPYEKFLYFDGQNDTTSSAPGLGRNYAHTVAVTEDSNFEQLNQSDGFKFVYKNSNTSSLNPKIKIFDDKYKIQDKPFFNHSSSVYLSFLLKGTDDLQINRNIDNHNSDGFEKNKFYLPYDTMYTASILQPSVTSSEYRRFVFEASASYFVPNTDGNDMANLTLDDFDAGSSKITILHTDIKTGSSDIKDSTNQYPTTVISESSGAPFKGSIMPAGDLFVLNYTSGSALSQSFITDVKVTFNNPTDVLPFDNVYKTTSDNWLTWYNGMLTKAENFDTDNIHSFENNLPLYIQDSSDFQDMKDFLNLQGEQYDLIKNHIDSLSTLHKRGYKKTDSPPDETLPILLSNMGWEAINPFSGSLSETLGSFLKGIGSIDDIKNNTWRKNLNNLIHIYKSKGTTNSVRSLLNIYGFPPDILQFKEFGGSTEESNPRIFTDNPPSDTGVDLSLDNETGSFSFTSKKQKLHTYRIGGDNLRVLSTEHYRNSAPVETIEFVYKHVKAFKDQQIVTKAAHATIDSELFDLRLVPSNTNSAAVALNAVSYSFEFRLNNSNSGSFEIADNAVSMSTNFLNMNDGQLWNVMLQRMTSSISGSGTNEYRLHTALQDNNSIKTYGYVTMSVSGGLTNTYHTGGDTMTGSVHGRDYFANQNWPGTGSFSSVATIGNLNFGGRFTPEAASTNPEMTGSLAEIRGWSTALSTSKFRQHTLNKFSTVGNSITAHKDELVYHFKLNENYSTASVSASVQNLIIVDSSPTTTYSNYSLTKDSGFFTSSSLYGFDNINSTRLTLQDNSQKQNNKNVIINIEKSPINNLDAFNPAVDSLTNPRNKQARIITSNKLEMYRSPQDFVDDFILDNVSGYNLERLYGNPREYHSQSYGELDTFRETFFDAHPVIVDTNKFIRAYESIYNPTLDELLQKVVPVRTTLSDTKPSFGVEIRPTILEKQKYENEEHSIEANPNTGIGSIDVDSITHIPSSNYETIKEGTIQGAPSNSGSLELPLSVTIKVSDSGSVGNPYLGFAYTSLSSSIENPYTVSISPLPTYGGSTVVTTKDGVIDYASIVNESFVDIHKNWGIGGSDTQFINYAGGKSSVTDDYNTYHIDTRNVFHAIGDNEYYSASAGQASNFDDPNRFFNRLMIDTDFHSNVTYESFISSSASSIDGAIVSGRMMGKTRYFITSSNGEITLPSNHVTKFSQPFKEQMINGTQNEDPGFLNVQYEDYSTASFYRVKVTGGTNQIRVQSGNPGVGSDDKIIYDDSGGGGAL